MATEFQSTITTLIAKCECTIRRGDAPRPGALQTMQRRLVTARDAPNRTEMETALLSAVEHYHDHVSAETRRTEYSEITERIERLTDELALDLDRRRYETTSPELER